MLCWKRKGRAQALLEFRKFSGAAGYMFLPYRNTFVSDGSRYCQSKANVSIGDIYCLSYDLKSIVQNFVANNIVHRCHVFYHVCTAMLPDFIWILSRP